MVSHRIFFKLKTLENGSILSGCLDLTEDDSSGGDLGGIEYKYVIRDNLSDDITLWEHGDNRCLKLRFLKTFDKIKTFDRYDCIMLPPDENDDKKGLAWWLVYEFKKLAKKLLSSVFSSDEAFKQYILQALVPNLYELDEYLNIEKVAVYKFNCKTMIDYLARVSDELCDNFKKKFSTEDLKNVSVHLSRIERQP